MSINDIINPNIKNPNITDPGLNKPTQPKNIPGEDSGTTISGIPIIYTGNNEAMKNGKWQQNAKATLDEDNRKRAMPKFELKNGKVTVTGSDEGLAHPTVEQAKKALSDAFSGADFSDKDVAVAFQKALKQINEQIGSQFDYEYYQDFLKRSGFSDGAYQNYAVARQEVEKSNPTNSSTIIETYDKNGKKVRKSIKEWFEYWKKEYNPEDRGVMWRKSLEYAYNPTTDDDLYRAIPAILMGANYGQNYLQGFLQMINPFDGKDHNAPTITPIHGFEDTNPASVAFQSAMAEFGRILPGAFGADENPYSWAGYDNGKDFFGIDNWDDKFFEDWSREDYQHWADLAYKSVKEGYDSYEKMRDEFGEEMARKMWMAYKFASRTQGGVGNGRMVGYMHDRDGNVIAEPGDYPGYVNYHDMYLSVANKTPAKAWDQNLQQSIERFANYNPNAATAGVMAGQIARIAAEQAALSLVSGGMLNASNIMKTIGKGLVKGGRALGVIKAGQEAAAMSSRVAKALSAMAAGSANGLKGASRIIYGLGKVSTWTAKELGEDVIRGLIDDVVTGNSFDSQGNLDPNRFLENVYMNAVMAGFGKVGGTIGSGVKTLLNANKNIDGVKLTSAAEAQMNDLAKAMDGSDGSAVKGVDKDGHPVIIKNGKEVTLDKVVASKANAEKLAPQQMTAKDAAEIADEIIKSNNVSDDVKRKVAEATGRDTVKGDTPAERFQNMPDSSIMTAISKTAKKFQTELRSAILNWRMKKLSAPLDALGIGAKTADGKTVMIDTGSYLKHNGLKSKSEVPAGIRDKMSSARSGGNGVEVKTLEQIADEATAATGVKYTADTVNRLINDYAKEYSKPITGSEVKQYFAENPGQQFTAWATGGGLNGEAKSTKHGFEYIMNKAGVSPDGTPKIRKGQGLNKDTRQQLKEVLEDNLSDEELREFIPNGKVTVNGKEMVIDTKNANMDDVASANGSTVTSLSDGISKLAAAAKNKGVRSFQEAMLGIRAHIGEFATKWKTAVEDFAKANNVEPRDVILGLRKLRQTGEESIPGLKDLWEKNWAPTANALLDLQDELTNVKTNRQKYYQRDMLKDTFSADDEGNWRANQNAIDELLDGDTEFEITASSTAKNKGKIEDDSLETDPEILAKEFVLSRLETINKRSVNGKIVNTMYEAMEDGEEMTARQASIAISKNRATGDEVRNSQEVKDISKEATDSDNIEELAEDFGKEDIKQIDNDIKSQKKQVSDAKKEVEAQKQKVKEAEDNYRTTDAQEYSKEQIYTPETERIKMEIAEKTGEDLDEMPFNILDDENGGVIRMLDEKPGRTREGSLRDYNRDYKGQETKVILVDPAQYNRVLKNDPSSNTNADTVDRITFDANTRKYAEGMRNGDKFPVPYIKYRGDGKYDGQEGRHRAVAAEFAGLNKIPVALSVPVGKSVESFGFTRFDDITDDVAKLVTENNRLRGADTKAAEAKVETAKKDLADAEAKLASEQRALEALETRKATAEKVEKAGSADTPEGRRKRGEAAVDAIADSQQKSANTAQDRFNKAADKSTTAKQISENSGYTKRAQSVAAKNPIGVNFMPGNPFKGFASWVNDNFVKSQSIQIDVDGKRYSVYSAGYSLYAEAASWARKAVLGIRDGQSLKDVIYNTVSQNGIKIEPSDYAKNKYNAMTSAQKDAETAGKIYNRLTHNRLFEKAVKDDRVVDTELLGSMLTKEFKRQGASEFMRFLRKSKFDSFRAGEQKWLNSQAYKITASFDPKTYKGLKANIQKFMGMVMSAKYRSNMYGNLKNAQLQLTEIQRLFTLNKLGDFGKTVARLVADKDFRDRVSDAAYIYASDSLGQGLSKQDLNLYREALDSYLNTANASSITAKGIITGVQNYVDKGRKAAIDGVDNDMLGAIEGAEYFKNYMLLAGILQSADSKGFKGNVADAYIRNRFNTEALAGTNVGRIGLVDSSIGRLAFMYLGFPIRELTLQAHIIKGGGNFGGTTKLDKTLGAYVYLNKMLGAKGLVWALEAPWGYKFADIMGYDPFGITDDRSNTEDNKNVDWWMRGLDAIIKYNPILQGAVTSAFVDVYMTYREAYEDAKDEWLETHDDLSGFEWDFDDAPQDKVWNTALGFAPGYTAFNRVAQQAGDLDRGFGKSSNGSLLYQTNTDPGNIAMGFIAGRNNTQNARDYYQTPDPIRDIQERGLAGLGRSIERAMPFRLNRLEGQQVDLNRQFREFDPYDTENYSDWFDGSFADQQQWTTGYYAFKQEAEEIRDRANDGVNQDNAIDRITSRENELGELRDRVERFVQAYIDNHPEGISNAKMGQIQSIFNMNVPDAGNSLDRVLGDYSDYEKNYAQNRVAAGNFPAPYGMNAPYADSKTGQETGDYSFAQSAQLKDVLSKNQYGIQSNAARVMQQLDDLLVATPYGSMKFGDYRDVVNENISAQYDSGNPDYDAIANLQEQYLDVFDRVIRPVFETYGSTLLNAGYKSDIMQQFTAMLNGLIPSGEYRIDKKGRRIRQSTPLMRVDIKKWLQKNYGDYPYRSSVDNDAESRLHGIEVDYNWGRTATARAKALALIEDVREGRAAISRENLEMLQNVLGVNGELSGGALLKPRVTNKW